MSISTKYNPQAIEDKWYAHWMEKGYFKAKVNPDKEPFTVVIPPPNVTGVLHMGHMLNNTIQDILIRKARMEGKEALWVPGTDHASIATEAKVVRMLREQGIKKSDLSRDEFLAHAWGVERKVWRNYPRTIKEAWCLSRLGQNSLYHGRRLSQSRTSRIC